MPEYKWPSKVQRYGINCPFQRFLVAKYESVIDWNGAGIQSPKALTKHLQEIMLPKLQQRIDPQFKDSYYYRTINLAHMLANPAEHIQQARDIRDRQGEEAARTFLLDHINNHKREAFTAWWDYLTKSNPVYAKNPAFQYLLLRPVLESSDAKNTRSPINPDAEALAYVYEGLEQGRILPRDKLLQVLCEFMAFGQRGDASRPAFGSACGWVVITKAQEKAADRVAALAQGSGWCVASSNMAASYLSHSDFHLLVENGRAVVAIRISDSQAVEIQGKGNQDPDLWWPRILLYLAARSIAISHRQKDAATATATAQSEISQVVDSIKALAQNLKMHPANVQFVSLDVVDDDNYRPVIEAAWLACIKADPFSAALAPTWMAKDQRLTEMVISGWKDLLKFDPSIIIRMPITLQSASEFVVIRQKCWRLVLLENPRCHNQCPSDLQNDREIQQAWKIGWRSQIERDPMAWQNCPAEFQGDREIQQARKDGWSQQLRRDVRVSKDCPATILSDPEVQKTAQTGWLQLFLRDPLTWKDCPATVLSNPDVQKSLNSLWRQLLKREPREWKNCPLLLQDKSEIQQARKIGWARRLKQYPHDTKDCPELVLSDSRVRKALGAGWQIVLRSNPNTISECPAFLLQLPEILKAQKAGWAHRIKRNPQAWVACPAIFQFDVQIIRALKIGLANRPPKEHSAIRFIVEDLAGRCALSKVKVMPLPRSLEIGGKLYDSNFPMRRFNFGSRPPNREALEKVGCIVMEEQRGWYVYIPLSVEEAILHENYESPGYKAAGKKPNVSPAIIVRAPPNLATIDWASADAATKESTLANLRRAPEHYAAASETIRTAPEVLAFMRGIWAQAIRCRKGDVENCPQFLLQEAGFRDQLRAFWSDRRNTQSLDFAGWMKCPAFLLQNQVLVRRGTYPIIRALRHNPARWSAVKSPWRELEDLRREAIEAWGASPTLANLEPPEDIRQQVEEFRKRR